MVRLAHCACGLAVIAAGCTPSPAVLPLGAPTGSVLRWIDDDAVERLESGHIVDYEPVFVWKMHDVDEAASWTPHDVDLRFRVTHDALELQSSTSDPRLVRRVDLEATTVDVVRVVMSRSTPDAFDSPQVFWAKDGGYFAPERSLRTSFIGSDDEHFFDVSKNPFWTGPIGRFRLDPTTIAGRHVSVRQIDGLRKQLNTQKLDAISGRAWKVDLDNDVRNALVTPPNSSVTRSLTIPPHSQLRFATGLWREVTPTRDVDLTLRVSFGQPGGTPHTLYEWQPGGSLAEHPDGWHEHRVNLAPLAHQEGHLKLEAISRGRPDLSTGLPVWTHPEVVIPTTPQPPNVILISIDTLRADHLSLYGHDARTSPNIDAWAKRTGITFERAVAQAPWTLPSHVSIFTGLDPIHHGVNHDRPAPPDLVTLAEVLRDVGYATKAFTDGVYLDPEYGLAQGFDAYAYHGRLNAFHEDTLGPKIDLSLEFMAQSRDRPFFLFLHTYEVHGPYRPRRLETGEPRKAKPWASDREINLYPTPVSTDLVSRYEPRWQDRGTSGSVPLTKEEFGQVADYYDNGIRLTDRQLAPLFEYLHVSGLEEETIVVLTSDHGEALGEGGRFGHAYLSDNNLLVPLVIAFPSRLPSGQRIPAQVRSIDILPTILDLAGIDAIPGIDGATLTPLLDNRSVGREALSYGANSNVGVSVRTKDGLQYIFNNTAASSTAGQEQLRLWKDEQSGLAHASTQRERARTLKAQVRRRLEQRPGLRVTLVNRSASSQEGILKSAALRPGTFKSSEEPCGCTAWRGSGHVDVRIPAGMTYTVVLEDVDDQPTRITGALAPQDTEGHPVSFDVDVPPRDRGVLLLKFNGHEWIEVQRESDISVGLKIWWVDDGSAFAALPKAHDPRLLRQLQTLGYIR